MDITQDGAVITGTINESLNIKANNVTVTNFKLDAQWAPYGINAMFDNGDGQPYTGLKVFNGEVTNANSAMIYGRNMHLRRLNIHDGGADAIKAETNSLIEYCFLHHTGKNPESHADGIQARWGNNIIIRYNRIWYPTKHNEEGYNTNAAIILQSATGPVHHCQIYGNFLEGGNYTVFLTNKNPEQYQNPWNMILNGNSFGRDYRYGLLRADIGENWQIDGNRWYDTQEFVDINTWDGDNQ